MHQLLFSLKRTHLSALAMSHRAIRPFSLTPARFDMLFAIRKHASTHFKQSDLRRLLGVNSATTSRMAIALEKLGLIQRHEYPYDRRQLVVQLTAEGTRALGVVEYEVVDYGMIDFAVTCAFAVKWYSESAISELYNLDDRFYFARGQLQDRATFYYDWHPDN